MVLCELLHPAVPVDGQSPAVAEVDDPGLAFSHHCHQGTGAALLDMGSFGPAQPKRLHLSEGSPGSLLEAALEGHLPSQHPVQLAGQIFRDSAASMSIVQSEEVAVLVPRLEVFDH